MKVTKKCMTQLLMLSFFGVSVIMTSCASEGEGETVEPTEVPADEHPGGEEHPADNEHPEGDEHPA
jgi:hypothetical protein